MKYKHLIYAGTFDRLHSGHKKLIDKAFEIAEKIAIGITSEEMVKKKVLNQAIETIDFRRKTLEKYLQEKNLINRTTFFELKDIFGPSIKDNSFDSIMVTKVTRGNADAINNLRIKKGLERLRVIVEKLLRGEDGEIISSERIRLGEIDKEGHNFQYSIVNNHNRELQLPKAMRGELRKPLGKVVSGSIDQLSETAQKVFQSINRLEYKPTLVIAVGDIITNSLLDIGHYPDIRIIDLKSRRREVKFILSPKHLTQSKNINRPGTINIKTALEIKKVIKAYLEKSHFTTSNVVMQGRESQLIIIDGEEDLLALPAILFAPLGSIVLYGQFDMGVVVVEVTEEKKKEVQEILRKFK